MMGHMDDLLPVLRSLDRWFERQRVDWPTPGYGGPVVHWWNHCLAYQGAGLDWRYEGIVAGYLTLYAATGEEQWMDRAIRAGDDLVVGQLADGHFRNSRFELNPGTGGTPHEAAADVALLLLTRALAERDCDGHARFLQAARDNLERYWFEQLWDKRSSTLWDAPGVPSFVPNKAATFLEAVLLLADGIGDGGPVERYAIPTGERILGMQVHAPGDRLDGAIAQNRLGDRVVGAYFPLYVARCVPPLLALYDATQQRRFRDGALSAARWLERVRDPDGGFPQVLYADGTMNRYPRWIAGAGDILRAFLVGNRYELGIDIEPTMHWILRGVRPDGCITTAQGFGRVVPLVSRRDRFADEIGVVGWCDKAFRALAMALRATDARPHRETLATLPVGVTV